MNKGAFIEKIKKENFWDYIDYYKEWKGYNAYIVGVDGRDCDLGLDTIILEKNGEYRYVTAKENLEIQGLLRS